MGRRFDASLIQWDKQLVKVTKSVAEKKTPGTFITDKHRPLMNKVSAAQRRRLRQRAAELLYGRESAASGR
jgi:hypothetical protein